MAALSLGSVVPWFTANDYDSVKRLVAEFPDRRDTFEQWLEVATERVLDIESRGRIAIKAHVDPKQFADYCRAIGQECNYATLGAYAVKVGRDQNDGRV